MQRRPILKCKGWSLAQRTDKTVWFGGNSGLWHLVHGNFVPIKVPREMIDQMRYLQAIAEDRAGGVWISFGRHGLYRLAEGVWTPFGGRRDLPGLLLDLRFRSGCTSHIGGSFVQERQWMRPRRQARTQKRTAESSLAGSGVAGQFVNDAVELGLHFLSAMVAEPVRNCPKVLHAGPRDILDRLVIDCEQQNAPQ